MTVGKDFREFCADQKIETPILASSSAAAAEPFLARILDGQPTAPRGWSAKGGNAQWRLRITGESFFKAQEISLIGPCG